MSKIVTIHQKEQGYEVQVKNESGEVEESSGHLGPDDVPSYLKSVGCPIEKVLAAALQSFKKTNGYPVEFKID